MLSLTLPTRRKHAGAGSLLVVALSAVALSAWLPHLRGVSAQPRSSPQQSETVTNPITAPTSTTVHRPLTRLGESPAQAETASAGCVSCHTGIEHPNMHVEETVVLGCADCHGGNPTVRAAGGKGSK